MNGTLSAILGIFIVFLMEILGAGVVFFFKKEIPKGLQRIIFGLSAGVMLAAAIWSLLLPALADVEIRMGNYAFIPIFGVFLMGTGFMLGMGIILRKMQQEKGIDQNMQAKKLFFSMAIHNIPEGLALGFAFGAAFANNIAASYIAVLGLAVGIGIQNLPEGAAVSLPLKAAYGSNAKAFLGGFLCAVIEPIFAFFGYFFAGCMQSLQTWLLAFSAGAIFFVVIDELCPAAKGEETAFPVGSFTAMFGFIVMTALDMLFA